ncbi:PF09998 family protein [Acinetobacter sp. WC-323]|nr:PF09998 family protein [Acinetobacter sp. WC-323]
MNTQPTYTAFSGYTLIAQAQLADIALKLKQLGETAETILIFNDQTGRQIDLDLSGAEQQIQQRYSEPEPEKKVGRPKLGVISREITLQKKHWDWLDQQSASASAVIRKLIDKELNDPTSESNIMLAKQATDRVMSAMLGNMPNYEEATRALYQGDREVFLKMIQDYPKDLKEYLIQKTQNIF